jgi:hypothetical protein
MLLKFCYNDLPRANRNCLLYLAIFPPGRTIWLSRLVMQWIVEGLITGRGMRRAVFRAEHCFDTLVSLFVLLTLLMRGCHNPPRKILYYRLRPIHFGH